MLYMAYTGAKNPERTKTGVFVSKRRQVKIAAERAREVMALKNRLILKP